MAEKEYIEREAVLRRMQKIATEAWKMRIKANVETVWNEAQDVLRFFPAADVRPVVLCRDCVNYVESDEANGEKMCVIDAEWCEEDGCYYGFNSYTEPDWFCAGGKKREES